MNEAERIRFAIQEWREKKLEHIRHRNFNLSITYKNISTELR